MSGGFDGSALLEASVDAFLAALIEHAERVPELRSVLFYRAVERLRSGTRAELHDEAIAIESFLASEGGANLAAKSPVEAGAWTAIAQLLLEAARRSDPEAVEMILRSHPLYGQRVLELLAEAGDRPLPRAHLIEHLHISQSQLSHLLRDFEEADLITRTRLEGTKEVMVSLGPVGRERVDRSLSPRWVHVAIGHIDALRAGRPLSVSTSKVEDELKAAGATPMIAKLFARALSPIVSAKSRAFVDDTLHKDAHARRAHEAVSGQSPVAAFGRSA